MSEALDRFGELSAAGAALARLGEPLVAHLRIGGCGGGLTGVLWRPDVIVTSEQVTPTCETATVVVSGGGSRTARFAGRDSGTNVAVFRLEAPVDGKRPDGAEAQWGALCAVIGSRQEGPTVKTAQISGLGPAWTSRDGGRLEARIDLDLRVGSAEEGGLVLDAAGHVLGLCAAGPRRRGLVIPATTVERVIDPLLQRGRLGRGWLGLELQRVRVPETVRVDGEPVGLMVMGIAAGGPAAEAGLLAGDTLLALDGRPTTSVRRLAETLGPEMIGQVLDLRYVRAGAEATGRITIRERPGA